MDEAPKSRPDQAADSRFDRLRVLRARLTCALHDADALDELLVGIKVAEALDHVEASIRREADRPA